MHSAEPLNVLIVCRFPPTIGGNSVHAQRLLRSLIDAGVHALGIDYSAPKESASDSEVVRLSGSMIRRYLLMSRAMARTGRNGIVHFHVSALGNIKWVFPVLLFLSRHRKRVVTIHGGDFVDTMDHAMGRLYLRWFFRWFDRVIVVNEAQGRFVKSVGVDKSRVSVIPAYLPQNGDATQAPCDVLEQKAHKTVVVTSGYLKPLYNYEVLIDSMRTLPASRYLFVFAFYNESDPAYERQILSALTAFPNAIVLRDQSPGMFLNLLACSDIYVRTTTMDGDAVAVREALHHHNRVFATDCVPRPDGCELFSENDSASLVRLFETVRSVREVPESQSPFERILQVYRDAIAAATPLPHA